MELFCESSEVAEPPLEGLPLPFTNHPIKLDIVRGPIVYIFHYFTLMYNFVRF